VANDSLRVQFFFAMRRLGGAVPPIVNFGPPNILETTRARKLKLKPSLDMVKHSLWV